MSDVGGTMSAMSAEEVSLAGFSAPTRAWFTGAFDAPTAAQAGAWDAIASGEHALVVAPTGSGKTLAAFLAAIDRLLVEPVPAGCHTALPGALRLAAEGPGSRCRAQPPVAVGRHHGGRRVAGAVGGRCPGRRPHRRHSGERASQLRDQAAGRADHDAGVALPRADLGRPRRAGGCRDRHRRRDPRAGRHQAWRPPGALARAPRRAARPTRTTGRAVSDRASCRDRRRRSSPAPGRCPTAAGRREWCSRRRARSCGSTSSSRFPISPTCPVHPRRTTAPTCPVRRRARCCPPSPRPGSIWPHVTERVVDLISAHRSTIVFTNSRRGAERLTARINEVQAARLAESAGSAGRCRWRAGGCGWLSRPRVGLAGRHAGAVRCRAGRPGRGSHRARPPRLDESRGAHQHRVRAQVRDPARPWWPPARSSSGSTWVRSISSFRWGRRRRWRARCNGSDGPGTRWARPRTASCSRRTEAICSPRRPPPCGRVRARSRP